MELRHLRYFVAVAEELNFRRAAESLHIAQPALSQQIKQLENEIGVRLLERTQHKVGLTAAGRVFYQHAQETLRAAQRATLQAQAAGQGEAGTITLGFVSSAAISVLPALLTFLRTQLPLAEVELKELAPGAQIDALYQNTLDLGLFHAQLKDVLFKTAIVTRERLIAALPATSRLAQCKQIDLREAAQETVIIPARHATSGYFETARAAFYAAGALPERVYHTNLLQTGLLLVGAGLGVSLVPESFERIQVEGVVYRPVANVTPTIDLIAAWRRDNASPLLARIVKEIKERSAAMLTAV